MFRSVGGRGVTVLTIITLVFAPVFGHHGVTEKQVAETVTTVTIPCVFFGPCPATETITRDVYLGFGGFGGVPGGLGGFGGSPGGFGGNPGGFGEFGRG